MWIALRDAYTILLGVLFEAVPFLLLGVLVSSWLHVYVSSEWLLRHIPRNKFLAILTGAGAGFVFPVCECGNIPVARRMIAKGVPPYIVIAFLVGAPVLNPLVIFSTWVAFRDQPEIIWFRILFTLIIVLITSGLFIFAETKEIIRPAFQAEGDHQHGHSRVQAFIRHAVREFFEMGWILVLGAFLAAFAQLIIPRAWLLSVGQGPIVSILALMLLASLISICSNVDAFFALSFSANFTVGSVLAFLVWGPVIDIKSVAMLLTTFRARSVLYLMLIAALTTFLLTLLWNYTVS